MDVPAAGATTAQATTSTSAPTRGHPDAGTGEVDPTTGAPCALDAAGSDPGAVDDPRGAPVQGSKVFDGGHHRWAICGASISGRAGLLDVRSVDDGRSWITTSTGLEMTPAHAGDEVIVTFEDFDHATIRLISEVAPSDRSYRTDDGGTHWRSVPAESPTPGPRSGPPRMMGGCTSAQSPSVPQSVVAALSTSGFGATQRVDIDGDGRPDTVALVEASDQGYVVVRTAAGATLTYGVPSAQPAEILATAVGGRGVVLVHVASADGAYVLPVFEQGCEGAPPEGAVQRDGRASHQPRDRPGHEAGDARRRDRGHDGRAHADARPGDEIERGGDEGALFMRAGRAA